MAQKRGIALWHWLGGCGHAPLEPDIFSRRGCTCRGRAASALRPAAGSYVGSPCSECRQSGWQSVLAPQPGAALCPMPCVQWTQQPGGEVSVRVVVVAGGSCGPLPKPGWGQSLSGEGLHLSGEAQTKSVLQLPGPKCLLWARPVWRLWAFNPGLCFEAPTPPRTCSCCSHFTDGKSEAQEM